MLIHNMPGTQSLFDKNHPYVGSDDIYYREHYVHLVESGWLWDTVLQNRRQREIMAMYLGILSVKDGQPTTTRPFDMHEITTNIRRRYRIGQAAAEDAISEAFANFIESVPEVQYMSSEPLL